MALFGIPAMLIGVGAALLLATALGAAALATEMHTALVLLTIVQGAVYAAAVFWVWRHGSDPRLASRQTVLFVIGLAVMFRALLLFAPPHSTDIYRYVWDGRVQADGINPYRYLPVDPALAHLRDEAIFPNINRREYAPTIYPPTAQIVYLAATRFGENLTVMKLAMVLFEAIAIWAAYALLVGRGLPGAAILVLAWHPLEV